MRKVFFLWALLPITLAFVATPASAAPAVAQFGNARVTVVISPDPPVVGSNAVAVQISGASPEALRGTTVRFATTMPSMNMAGPSGLASHVAGRPDEWNFRIDFGAASPWMLRLQLSGAISGSLNENLLVGQISRASSSGKPQSTQMINSMTNTGLPSASGMGAMAPSGDWTAWRTGAFVLVGLGLIALVVLRRDRRTATIALFALAAVVVLAITMAKAQYASPPMDMNAMENVAGTAPVAVRTIRVHAGFQSDPVVAPGTVAPYFSQSIVARASGILSDFNVYNGDKVQAGQQIAYLNEPELGSSAAAAQAAAQAAQIEANHHAPNDVRMAQNDIAAKQRQADYWSQEIARERMLLREGAVSQQEYQNEAAQAASAQADLRNAIIKASDAAASVGQARAQYSQAQNEAQTQSTLAGYRSVIAPDDAVVVKRLVDPGTYVQAGTPIAQIAVLDKLRVQANVAQSDVQKISLGDPVDAALPNGQVVHGRVSSIQPVADPATHTGMVEAIVSNLQDRLQPGGFVHVTIHARSAARGGGDAIPAMALVGGANGSLVYVIKDGAAQPVHVQVLSNDGATAIVRGLSAGADVITDGATNLQPGQAVTETKP